ncbi:MAG: hypothetical protein KDK39_15035 [Leptospiraceae bacterium]|nr:hypothetical protein [Leptospiraceae bacterium]
MIHDFAIKFRVTGKELIIYIVVYLTAGFINNEIGKFFAIAEFRYWWQVLSCYGLYLIPVSLYLRDRSLPEQYVYGVFFLGICELSGYTIGSSIAHPGNIFEQLFGPLNVSLAMSLVFAVIPPIGNTIVRTIRRILS